MVKVLGSSGGARGVDGNGNRNGSTCIQLNESTIIDSGTGIESLSLDEMKKVRNVLLTHSHMDHIAMLPLILTNLFGLDGLPVKVFGSKHTINSLRGNIFNNDTWPDFTKIEDSGVPIVELITIEPEQSFDCGDLIIAPFEVEHTVPTLGYSVKDKVEDHHFVFCADCIKTQELSQRLNAFESIDTLMIECSFPDHMVGMAEISKHMTPSMVESLLSSLDDKPGSIWITHLKPNYEDEIRFALKDKCWIMV